MWLFNNKRHRRDGPAVEQADGTKEWWIKGVQFTEAEFSWRLGQTIPVCTDRPDKVKWELFSRGDVLSTSEIESMIKSIDNALPFLEARPDFKIALTQAVLDKNRLTNMLENRNML
jgi:hypothetical protein